MDPRPAAGSRGGSGRWQRLAQRALGIVGYADAQKAHHQLFFSVVGADARLDLLHHAQKRPAEEVVTSTSNPRNTWKAASWLGTKRQGFLLAKEQQGGELHTTNSAVGIHYAQRPGSARTPADRDAPKPRRERFAPRGRAAPGRFEATAQHCRPSAHRRVAIAAERAAGKNAFASRHGLTLWWNFDDEHDEHGLVTHADRLQLGSEVRACAIGDQGRQFVRIDPVAVPVAGAGDTAIVLHTDQQPGRLGTGAVGQSNHRFDEVTIVEWRPFLAPELDREGFACGDHLQS